MLKFTNDTSTFPLDELLVRWRRGDLTETQMVGHRSAELTTKPPATPDAHRQTRPPPGAATRQRPTTPDAGAWA